jgi:beta-glucanase (GH16 family)
MRNTIATAAAALLLSAGLGLAQDAPVVTEDQLDAADASGDDAVSLDEFRAYMRAAFDALDADGDGVVVWTDADGVIPRAAFDTIDADADGRLTAAEMDAQARADFDASDLDGDGLLN